MFNWLISSKSVIILFRVQAVWEFLSIFYFPFRYPSATTSFSSAKLLLTQGQTVADKLTTVSFKGHFEVYLKALSKLWGVVIYMYLVYYYNFPKTVSGNGRNTGGIQNIPDWCRHQCRSCGSAKHRPQQAKLWIPGFTAKFCGDRVKTCEDVAPNFDENTPGCFTMTTPRLTLPSSPRSFWPNTKWLSSPTHRTPLIWHPVTSSCFQKWY
jgi:hypothetical protein